MGLKRTVEPVATPVSLAEAKAQCRVLHDDEDDLITDLIAAAVSMVEDYCGRSLMQQTWRLTLDKFSDTILLPRGPVASLTSFQYYDTAGNLQTVPADTYTLDTESDPSWIVRNSDASWPVVQDGVNSVRVTYVTGYSTVPAAIKQAILMLVASWFRNREALLTGTIVAEMPLGTMALLQNHRAFA